MKAMKFILLLLALWPWLAGARAPQQPQMDLPPPSREGLQALLAQGRYEQLEHALEQYRLVSLWSMAQGERPLLQSYRAFESTDAKLGAMLDLWVEKRAESAEAYTARAHYRVYNGWDARGTAAVAQTPPERLALMARYFELAQLDVVHALQLQPQSLPAWRALIEMNRAGSPEAVIASTLEGLKLFPASLGLRQEAMFGLQPRWGGNLALMRSFAQSAQEEAGNNPQLRSLLGYPDWEQATELDAAGKTQEAFDAAGRALAYGEEEDFLKLHGRLALKLQRHDEALADARAAARLSLHGEFLEHTVSALRDEAALQYRGGKLREAAGLLTDLIDAGTGGDEARYLRGAAYCRLGESMAALEDLRNAGAQAGDPAGAQAELLECLGGKGHLDDAVAALRQHAQDSPASAAAGYFAVGRVYASLRREDQARANIEMACTLGSAQACAWNSTGLAAMRSAANDDAGLLKPVINRRGP